MRIGLSGPIWGHKTDLMESVKTSIKFRNYEFDETKEYIHLDHSYQDSLHEQVYNIYMKSHVITTCTTFDTIVNSKYLLDANFMTEEEYLEVGKAWLNTMELYNVIFYLPPEDDEEVTTFEADIWSLFDRAILKYEVPVITLTGTKEERKKQFMRIFL